MFIKTVFLSIIIIFLLQLIYNFIYDRFLTKNPPNDTKFTEIEKYKKIAEEATAAIANVSSIKHTSPPPLDSNVIETIFNNETDVNYNSSPEDMENCLLNLVING